MIAIESFRRFRIIDVIIIIVLSSIWTLSNILISQRLNPQASFIFSLLVLVLLMSFTIHLIRKAGSATFFYAVAGLMTYSTNDFGVIGLEKVIAFIIAGLIFELVFLLLRLELKSIQIDIIFGSGLSAASIPFFTAFFVSLNSLLTLFNQVLNLMLLAFFVGIAGSVISFLIWYNLRTTKLVLEYEYRQ